MQPAVRIEWAKILPPMKAKSREFDGLSNARTLDLFELEREQVPSANRFGCYS
jgi:hypothetical protein